MFGLGRAIALQLARDAPDVTVHGRDAGRGVTRSKKSSSRAARPLRRGRPHDAASVTRFAREVGDIDILVNNAGFSVGAHGDL